jgi:hypothetical protein
MARVALLLGGNEGDMKRTLQTAQRLINERVGAVMRCSHRYQSEAWGFNATLPFTNQALEISTDLSPIEVLDAIQQIELELGRNRAAEQIEKAANGELSEDELEEVAGGIVITGMVIGGWTLAGIIAGSFFGSAAITTAAVAAVNYKDEIVNWITSW